MQFNDDDDEIKKTHKYPGLMTKKVIKAIFYYWRINKLGPDSISKLKNIKHGFRKIKKLILLMNKIKDKKAIDTLENS